MQQTIIAEHNEVDDRFRLGIVVESKDESIDILSAMRAAAAEFCATDEGRAEVESNGGSFNWGDMVNSVGEELCSKHGFRIVDTFVTELIVDHNELLNDGDGDDYDD